MTLIPPTKDTLSVPETYPYGVANGQASSFSLDVSELFSLPVKNYTILLLPFF